MLFRTPTPSYRRAAWMSGAFLALAIGGALAQYGPPGRFGGGFGGGRMRGGGRGRGGWGREIDNPPPREIFPSDCFTFCRIQYTGDWGPGHDGQDWNIDSPQADSNLSLRLSQTTTIRVKRTADGQIQRVEMPLTDPDLFKYPIAFITEPGVMSLNESEQKAMRSYLLRGGFLVFDDFHGDVAWSAFADQMNNVLPSADYPIVDIPQTHQIFHMVFDIDKIQQVPTIHLFDYEAWKATGDTVEWGHDYASGDTRAHCRGIFDKQGRLMCAINFNTDLGDGWQEEGTNADYFRIFSARAAFPLGINIVAYAMTH